MLYLLLVLAILLITGLIYAFVRLKAIGENVVDRAFERAKKQTFNDKAKDALALLYRTLRANGWDYQGFKCLKKPEYTSIRLVEPGFTKVARLLRAMPKNNFHWVAEPLFFLFEIYKRLDMQLDFTRLLLDMRTFIDDFGSALPRPARADLLSRISHEQALLEMEERNYRSVVHMEAAAYLHTIEKLHAEGDMERLEKLFPCKPNATMLDALTALERSDDAEMLGNIIDAGIIDNGARIDLQRVFRDIDDALRGRQTKTERERQMARMIYERVVEKNVEKSKE